MPDPATKDILRSSVLSAVALKELQPDWSDAIVDEWLNFLDNFVKLANILDVEIDQKIEEVPTDFLNGSIPVVSGNLLIEDNANLFFDIANKILNAANLKPLNLTPSRIVASDASKVLASVASLSAWIAGTVKQITVSDDGDGTITLSLPQNIDTSADVEFDSLILDDLTASRLTSSDGTKKLVSVAAISAWVAGTSKQITVTDDGDGTATLSTPQNIDTDADVEFDSITLGDLTALELVFANAAKKLISIPDGSADDLLTTDGAGAYSFKTLTLPNQLMSIDMYDPIPARGSESNWCGGIKLLTAGTETSPTATQLGPATPANDITVSKGIGKLLVIVVAGSDVDGTITVTGTKIDRNTGASTPAHTNTITVDAITTNTSATDANGNRVHAFSGAYITDDWFTGSVVLSTSTLNCTVYVYHVSFEQLNDTSGLTLRTFDANIYTTGTAAEFDAYLYVLMKDAGNKCNITNDSDLHVGALGETAIASRYWRLRRGNIDKALDGATDGFWVDIHYSNSPVQVEDVTIRAWFTLSQTITLT